MKKAWICFLTALTVISMVTVALHAEEESKYPTVPHMSLEDYPEVDGSLACIPLMEALVMEVTGCTETEAEESLAN